MRFQPSPALGLRSLTQMSTIGQREDMTPERPLKPENPLKIDNICGTHADKPPWVVFCPGQALTLSSPCSHRPVTRLGEERRVRHRVAQTSIYLALKELRGRKAKSGETYGP